MSDKTTVLVQGVDATTVEVNSETVVVVQEKTTVVGTTTAGPQGSIGPTGPAGPVPIYVGPTPPVDTSLLWVDTSV